MIHALALLLLLGLATHPGMPVGIIPKLYPPTHTTVLKPYMSPAGGGGQMARTPASAGHLPKVAPRQFVPPAPAVNTNPKLAMVPTIEAPADMPDLKFPNVGDPTGLAALSSAGRGGPGGYGDHQGTGVGSSSGGSGVGQTVYTAGGGVTQPIPIRKVEPEYSEEARKARANGTVVVYVEIGEDGKPHNMRVAQSFGLGLDEKALDAVSKWLFRPGTRNGKPVTVSATIAVSFRLL